MFDAEALIGHGREERSLEYKQSQPLGSIEQKLIKTCLGLANTRDGGSIVIGMRRLADGTYEPAGVEPGHRTTYVEDELSAKVNQYADPHVNLQMATTDVDGVSFVVIHVEPFASVPIVCRADGPELRQGALYVRSSRIIETAEVRTAEEMRAILDMAVERRLAELLGLLARAGVDLELAAVGTATRRFEEQLQGL